MSMQVRRDEGENYEEFLNLFTRDRDRIFSFVCSLVPRLTDAEDIFQKCSLVLWRKFQDFRSSESFLAWACGIARLEVLNALRTDRRNKLLFDEDLVRQLATHRMQSICEHQERLFALRSCVETLSDDQRDLLDAAYGNGNTIKNFAEFTGSAVQTLYNRLGKLRRQLFHCVESKLASQE